MRALDKLTWLSFALIGVGGCTPDQPEGWSSAKVIGDLTDAIGGEKAVGQAGDIILENDEIRLVILGDRTSYGPAIYGGSLLDADLQRNDPRYTQGQGNDLWSELMPTINLKVLDVGTEGSTGTVEIVNDGSNGEAAVVRVKGESESYVTLLDGIWVLIGAPNFNMSHDYILEPGATYATLRTTVTYGGGNESEGISVTPFDDTTSILDYAIDTGVAIGDFYMSGGSLNDFLPGFGFDEKGLDLESRALGRNTFNEPYLMDFVASVGENASYGLAAADGPVAIPMFASSQTAVFGGVRQGDGSSGRFEDGEAFTYERYFTVGEGDVGSVLDRLLPAFASKKGPTFGSTGQAGIVPGKVTGNVIEQVTGVSLSDVSVFVYRQGEDDPWNMWRTDVGSDSRLDGSFGGSLPPGEYTVVAHQQNRPASEPVDITVTQGETSELVLTMPMQGQVSLSVVDQEGRSVPSKVTVFSHSGESTRDFNLGDGYISDEIVDVAFLPHGTGDVLLPPGTYSAVASRGIEYEIHEIGPFEVSDRQHLALEFQVLRSVETTGYIGADLHVHAIGSHDVSITLEDRVATMVAEGVEFFTSTDHDYIADYRPAIESMSLEPWVRSVPGIETSTAEIGHFLGFPLKVDHLEPANGALDWVGLTPTQIFDEIRSQGTLSGEDPITFISHARDGIFGYFDQYGLNPYLSTNGDFTLEISTLTLFNPLLSSMNFTLDFDALELFNGKRFDLLRTPTADEVDAYNDAVANDTSIEGMAYDFIERTMEEQDALIASASDGETFNLAYGVLGQVDDWFTLLNLGYRHTALANSDTHNKTTTEAGCPRNYIASNTDDPGYVDVEDLAVAIRNHNVIATYGPFIRFEVDNAPIGSEIVAQGTTVEANIEVQSPSWFDVSRVELYENGTLIENWTIETPNVDTINFTTTHTLTPTKDSWYVVVALGEDDLSPLFTPTERPNIQLQDVVIEALGPVDALAGALPPSIARPRTYPTFPYGLTNPIWVDLAGDGWTPPGLPSWLVEPEEPEEEETTVPEKSDDTGVDDTADTGTD